MNITVLFYSFIRSQIPLSTESGNKLNTRSLEQLFKGWSKTT